MSRSNKWLVCHVSWRIIYLILESTWTKFLESITSHDVMWHFEIPSKRTIFVMQQIYLVLRHSCHVALEVTSYHDCKTGICCNRSIFSLTTCEVLRHATAFFCIRPVYYKTLIPWIPMPYHILNLKMTLQSLSNSTELLALFSSTQKFDNDCDVIFMFKI